MSASRFVCIAVALWMLGNTAWAQRPPLVQVAPAIDLVSQRDVVEGPIPASAVQVNVMHGDTNSWVLTDESIDEIASQAIAETEVVQSQCDCGQPHCHGVCRDPGHPKKPRITKPGDRDRGDCPPLRYRMNDCERAGNPHCYHRWAKCSVDEKYSAWFVGGGSPFAFARGRTSSEGTWGLDYGGLFGHAKVWLNYTHGRNQGGVGAYRTDGEPKIVSRAHELMHIGH